MENILNCISENKEWLFSGLGIVLLGWIVKIIFFRNKPTQVQKSGKDSINIQAGGDVHIGDTKWMDKNKK
ncbi:hypothetical protein [Fibrobacter sp. UWB13]|uniref:hypothetical protein n=1 Tax=Fibrobacter sp. UWB13 TaxID=1896204 RepID=UPI000A0EC563|nr:hypothetical protein [Fibrobacter sp. UWB13]SMG34604.1 hypothetical protein SAMN05720489_2380 [Fibrobacter sp. UWB13]